jgi:uncharacterized damage-inducible protein DinB
MSSPSTATNNRIATSLINEMKNEIESTRKCLERLPAEKFSWKPHDKSMELGRLASHLAEMFGWTKPTMENAELDFATMDYKPFEPKTTAELLEFLEKHTAEALATLEDTPDEAFMKTWSLRNGEQVYFTLPKVAVMRSFVLNHIYHHRGQLTVYMRLLDVPVPGIYGPSADEPTM